MSKKTKKPDKERGYEVRDTNFQTLLWSGIGFLGLVVFSFVLILWVFSFLQKRQENSAAPAPPLADSRPPLPKGPKLQVLPEQDLEKFNAVQDSLLENYGWEMREAGLVRLPIDRAIELTLERGLPVRTDHEEWKREDRRLKMED
ncbi:MAG: hypothetical protein ACE5IR_07180 [bacterium]